MEENILREFIQQSIYRIGESMERVNKCVEELTEKELWESPNEHSNSIANLILHLCGNVRQYIISGVGGANDTRIRDEEFSICEGYSKIQLLDKFDKTITEAKEIIKQCPSESLKTIYHVQGFQLSGVGIIIHVTEHLSYHTGQIAFWTKQLKNKDLRFYGDINLNARNKS